MTYKVKLEIFEGPLDLLYYLIKKNEINIHDIPIAVITDQYLQYLDFMKLLDLNIAGEFLVMAATLMHIKSRMLLPQEELNQEEREEEDPREELVRKLIEYKKFKEAAGKLQDMEKLKKETFSRSVTETVPDSNDEDEMYFEAGIFDLISAFTRVLKEVPKDKFYEVIKDEVTVSEKMHEIFHLLIEQSHLSFFNLFQNAKSKIGIIATFLALLELIRMKEVLAKQDKAFGDIIIIRNAEKTNTKLASKTENGAENADGKTSNEKQ